MSLRIRLHFKNESRVVDEVDYAALELALRVKIQEMLDSYGPRISARARQLLQERTRRPEASTGHLSSTIRYRVSANRLTVYAAASYAGWVEEDTKPHTIRPVHAKALRWGGRGGDVHYAQSVRHPGTTGKHMVRDAVAEYDGEIREKIRGIIEQSLWENVR